MFDVRQTYFDAEEKRDTFVETSDCVPADLRATCEGKLRKALQQRAGAMSCEKGLSAVGSSSGLCRAADSVITLFRYASSAW